MIKKPLEEINDDIIQYITFNNRGLTHLDLSGHSMFIKFKSLGLKKINKLENIPTLTNLNIKSLHGIENILYLQELDCSNNSISSLEDLETFPNIIMKLSLKNNPLISIYSKNQYHELIQTKFPNLKYLDGELFIHQNYSYSSLNTNKMNSDNISNDSEKKISLKEHDEIVKKVDEYQSKIESLEEIIRIQDANNNNNNNNNKEYILLNKWREKVYQLLIQNKLNEKIKNREIFTLKEENKKLKNEKEEMKKDIRNSMNMFYHSFSDIYRQIMVSSDSIITKCNSKIHQLTEIVNININPIFERMSTENYGFEETIDNLVKENEELKMQINQYQIELDNISQNFSLKEKDLNNQIDKINEICRLEKSSYREANKTNEELNNKISQLESENEMLKKKIEKVSIEKQSLDIRIKDLDKKIEKLTIENNRLIRDGLRLTHLINNNKCGNKDEDNEKEDEENDDDNDKDYKDCSSSDSSSDSDYDDYVLTNNRKKKMNNNNNNNRITKEKEKKKYKERSSKSVSNKSLSKDEELKLINNMIKIIDKS